MSGDSRDAGRNGEEGLSVAAAAGPHKRASRQLTRQLTFVDIERSCAMAGENGNPIENGDIIDGSNGNDFLANDKGLAHGSENDDNDDRKVAIVTGATVSPSRPPQLNSHKI